MSMDYPIHKAEFKRSVKTTISPSSTQSIKPGHHLSRASHPKDFTRPFLRMVFFRAIQDGLSERETTQNERAS